MTLPGVGTFLFGPERSEVVAHPESSASQALIEDAFRRTVLPMALQVLGREVLHASAVLGPKGVLGLCAVSETGKSTLAYALGQRGFEPWADDALAFDVDASSVEAVPLPFALYLRPASAQHFGLSSEPEAPVFLSQQTRERAPLTALFVLEGRKDPANGLAERLPPVAAFPALLAHAYCFTLADVERKGRMMRAYLDLAARTPVFRLRVVRGLERLEATLDALEDAIGEPSRPA